MFPICTDTGVFGCMYVAVVASPDINLLISTSGSLLIGSPSIAVTNFLRLKSKYFPGNNKSSKSSSSSSFGSEWGWGVDFLCIHLD